MRVQVFVAAALISFAGLRQASAAFVPPTEWTRPTNDAEAQNIRATYQEWNAFTSPRGPNDPDVADVNPNPGVGPNPSKANLYDTSGQSLITSGGNIYSPTAATLLDVDVPDYGLGGGYRTSVMFQLRTLGSEVNDETVRLSFNDGADRTIPYASRQELARVPLGGFGGSQVDTLFRFDVPFSPSAFKIEFDSAGSSMSTDRVAVDTFTTTVPEPASLTALGVAGLLLGRRRRKP
jgi:hypothetical protein